MTLYQIEIRVLSDEYDVHAHRVARDMLRLSSLQTKFADAPPLYLSTSQLYHLSGNLSSSDLSHITQQLLRNPVTQEAIFFAENDPQVSEQHIIDVFYHPGVTDTLSESVLQGVKMLGIQGLEQSATGQRYHLDARLSTEDLHTIARNLLYNPVIQDYTVRLAGEPGGHFSPLLAEVTEQTDQLFETIPLGSMNDEQLLEVSKKGLLALDLQEMRTIQAYYREQGREATDVELETLAQTWSEHCSHKTFKAAIEYRELDAQGREMFREAIPSLIKRYLMRATEEIRPDWLVSAFVDNAGIIRFTENYDIAFKAETHNHPSAIEPFGGANTGVGGVIRDVVGVSAKPIACTDVLCFGPPETPDASLPEGILSPQRIASGVVNGVRDYGNKMGIPTVNGAILYDRGYIYNPLVFCGCVGLLPHGSHPNQARPGDLIVSLGGRTGRDGIHGATFSSIEMSSEINTQVGSAVQIGAPITEKKVTDLILQARDLKLYSAITDCGAGGFSSAIGEMGAETGVRVELAKAPLKYQGLKPWEIWLSEAQERMVLAVPPQHLPRLLELCEIEEVEASVLGTFTNDHHLTVCYNDEVVANLDMQFLHDGRPKRHLEAYWQEPQARKTATPETTPEITAETALLKLLSHPSIASKEDVVRRYDHEVQGGTMLKPLVGKAGNGPGDAAVIQPILDHLYREGIVISNGVNPLYGKYDAYQMALNGVDEALRNLTAVGGDIKRTAILDNFCWGSSVDPVQLGTLVRAVKGCYDAAVAFGTPFISGKDSLNNEYRANGERIPVLSTLLISAMGVIDDVAKTIDMPLKRPGNAIYQVGVTSNELLGSHYGEVLGEDQVLQAFPGTRVPQVNLGRAKRIMVGLGNAIRAGLVKSCHDLSEGGLAVAIAEMALANGLGADLDLQTVLLDGVSEYPVATQDLLRLYSESPSRFLVEVEPEQSQAFETFMSEQGITELAFVGAVVAEPGLTIRSEERTLLELSLEQVQAAWKGERA